MSDISKRTPEEILFTYFRAKEGNRPHLMAHVFSESMTLETVVRTEAISFPSVSTGLATITDVLVRKFAQTYENVYSFYLGRPQPGTHAEKFSCDWLVGMSAKEGGSVRVGCGRYDWRFLSRQPCLADRLVITIEAMEVLSPESLDPVLGWLTGLPYLWCSAEAALETAPDIGGLAPIFGHVARGAKRA